MSGGVGWLNTPVAPITWRAWSGSRSPLLISSRQSCASSSKVAPVTRELNRIRGRTSYLSVRDSAYALSSLPGA